MHSAANLVAIAVLAIGLGLFVIRVSQDKRIDEIKDNRTIIVLSWLLVLWGIIVTLAGLFGYELLLQWASDPYKRPLSAWEYLECGTRMLKGSLWAVSGLFLVRAFDLRFSKYVHEILSHDNLPGEI